MSRLMGKANLVCRLYHLRDRDLLENERQGSLREGMVVS